MITPVLDARRWARFGSTVAAAVARPNGRLAGDPVVHVDERAFTLAQGDFVHIPMGTTHWFEVLDAPVKVLAGYCPVGVELAFL